jgi:DNA-binding response OmpR family regulator
MSDESSAAPTRLLVVEDDDSIAVPLEEGLSREGFSVERVRTGEAALAAEQPDFVLLDLGLPDLDGGEVCRRLRSRSDVPIIVITARSDELDRVLLLEMGADDYVVKPFGFRELVARIRAVRRRTSAAAGAGAPADVQQLGPLQIDRAARRVTIGDEEIDLTPKEFDLLVALARQPGRVCERHDLIEQVWDEHWWGSTKTLDVHVAGLRRKLGHPEWITTMRGVGYRFDGPA